MAPMTAYEIITIFIGILALLMSFGMKVVKALNGKGKGKYVFIE